MRNADIDYMQAVWQQQEIFTEIEGERLARQTQGPRRSNRFRELSGAVLIAMGRGLVRLGEWLRRQPQAPWAECACASDRAHA